MRIVLFYHSAYSDWNHGNAHFLRGIAGELQSRGHDVLIYEPRSAWSLRNLLRRHGRQPIREFRIAYPRLRIRRYDAAHLDLDQVLAGADLVVVHEWNDPDLVRRIGQHRHRHSGYRLFFHDTHHRSVSDPAATAAYDLTHYDAVLAFGEAIRRLYLENGWARRAYTWHEAADVHVFRPLPQTEKTADLVWIGNWGDEERTQELREFLIEPVRALKLRARVHGVRYPEHGRRLLAEAGIEYCGWAPNFRVPEVFARHRLTVHIPRRPYVEQLPGIPTIRVFEALACGIPLLCSPWQDAEHLFTPGRDYLVAADGRQMREHLLALLDNPLRAAEIATHGRNTVLARHTCAARVDELLRIYEYLSAASGPVPRAHADTQPAEAAPTRRPGAASARPRALRIAFFGSSLVSAYWNGAATYYRGILSALHALGHESTFYEPDAFDRQKHRDIPDPPYARTVVYSAASASGVRAALHDARDADLVIKASGVGVFDELLEAAVLELKRPGVRVLFWDVDAPATLERVQANPADPFRRLIPEYDFILTYGGGEPVAGAYTALGARHCVPIYNALDPATHHPVPSNPAFAADLGFLGNRLPDREQRVHEFFFDAARRLPQRDFLLGGNGWAGNVPQLPNVRYLGHVYTRDHNAFNCTPLAVLNISRASMARFGFSPATRVFEAAGAAACIITDAWEGIELFLEPGCECLVAHNGSEVAELLSSISPERARQIGRAAQDRVLREHTYADRARQLERLLC